MDSNPAGPGPAPTRQLFGVPAWVSNLASWAWRILVIVAALVVFGFAFQRLRVVIVPVFTALMLASVLAPAVRWLMARRLPRLLATWLVLLATAVAVSGVLIAAGWGLTTELAGDSARWDDVRADVREWLRDGPLDLSTATIDDLEDDVRSAVVGGVTSLGSSRASLMIELISGVFLTIALTFFFVKDGPEMWRWLMQRVDPDRREALDEAGTEAIGTLSSYFRAVAITGVIDAVVIGVGLLIIGVPLVVPLAIITFFGAFFPVVGATAAGAIAAVVALVAGGPVDAVLVVLLTLAVQQIEGDVIMPVIMGHSVPLHPAVVLAALTAGGALAGIVGAFVAVPAAAVSTKAISVLRRHRRFRVDGERVPDATRRKEPEHDERNDGVQ